MGENMKTYSYLTLFMLAALSFSSMNAMEKGEASAGDGGETTKSQSTAIQAVVDHSENSQPNKSSSELIAVQAVVNYLANPQTNNIDSEPIKQAAATARSASRRQGRQKGIKKTENGVLEQLSDEGIKSLRSRECPESVYEKIIKLTEENKNKLKTAQFNVTKNLTAVVLAQLNPDAIEQVNNCPDEIFEAVKNQRKVHLTHLQDAQTELEKAVLTQFTKNYKVEGISEDFFIEIKTVCNEAKRKRRKEMGGIFTKSNMLSGGTGGTIIALAWLGKWWWNR